MRDLLTVCAVAVIAALLAALIGPHFIDWTAQRARIDAALGEALGLEAATHGELELRLLPAPVLQAAGVSLRQPAQGGTDGAGRPADPPLLSTGAVRAELALGPLLGGQWRIVNAAIDRPVLRLIWPPAAPPAVSPTQTPTPTRAAQAPPVAAALDTLRISNGALILVDVAGRQTFARTGVNAVLSATALTGAWRAQGDIAGAPFSLSSGEADGDSRRRLRLALGEPQAGRLEYDGDVALNGAAITAANGKLLLSRRSAAALQQQGGASSSPGLASAAGDMRVSAHIMLRGTTLTANTISVELGDPSAPLRLEGKGGGDLAAPDSLAFTLAAARLDLAALAPASNSHGDVLSETLAAVTQAVNRWAALAPYGSVRLEAGALVLGEEETGAAAMILKPREAGVSVSEGQIALPGAATLRFSGDVSSAPRPFIAASAQFTAPQPALLAPWLARLGADAGLTAWLARQPQLSLSGRYGLSREALTVHGLRLQLGAGELGGMLASHAGDVRAPRRFDAQLSAREIDLADLPPGLMQLWRGAWLHGDDALGEANLSLSGTKLRLGRATALGDVHAQASLTGDGLRLKHLRVSNLGGVDIDASGALTGTGEPLSGAVRARSLAQLAALARSLAGGDAIATPWRSLLQSLQRPELAVPTRINFRTAMRDDGGAQISFDASASKGGAQATGPATAGLTASGQIALAPPDTGVAALTLREAQVNADGGDARLLLAALAPLAPQLSVAPQTGGGAWTASWRLTPAGDARAAASWQATASAFGASLSARSAPQGAQLSLATTDATPLLRALGVSPPQGEARPWRLDGQLTWPAQQAAEDDWRLSLTGTAGAMPLQAEVAPLGQRGVAAQVQVAQLSLPQLAQALVLGPVADSDGWSSARFLAPPRTADGVDGLRYELTFRADQLELGRGVAVNQASLGVSSIEDGVRFAMAGGAVRTPSGQAGGALSGALLLRRQGASASLSADLRLADARLGAWGVEQLGGVADVELRLGASGGSVAAIVANLAGNGVVRLRDGALAQAAPEAPAATAHLLITDPNALEAATLQRVAQQQLGLGAFPIGTVQAPVVMTGGVARLDPPPVAAGGATLDGELSIDVRNGALSAAARLQAQAPPPRWKGGAPALALTWRGPLAAPQRATGVAELQTALAALRLEDELQRVEAFRREAQRLQEEARKRQEEVRRREEERARQAAEAELRRAREDMEAQARQLGAPQPPGGASPQLLQTPPRLQAPPAFQPPAMAPVAPLPPQR